MIAIDWNPEKVAESKSLGAKEFIAWTDTSKPLPVPAGYPGFDLMLNCGSRAVDTGRLLDTLANDGVCVQVSLLPTVAHTSLDKLCSRNRLATTLEATETGWRSLLEKQTHLCGQQACGSALFVCYRQAVTDWLIDRHAGLGGSAPGDGAEPNMGL